MTLPVYDVAILGLGPAGAILASLLDRSFSVIAIDKKGLDNQSFRKPCGGLLSPNGQKALASLGLTLPKSILVDPQVMAVKTFDFDQNLQQTYPRSYFNFDRHLFDLWLISLIPPTVETHLNSSWTKIARKNEGYEVTYFDHLTQQYHTILAKRIVGADGAFSRVRKWLYPQKKIRCYTSIQQWFTDLNPVPFQSCVFDATSSDCYCWTIAKDQRIIIGGAFAQHQARKHFDKLKQHLQEQGFRLGDLQKTEACLLLRPEKFSDFCCGKDDIFLLGEAAGLISASSFEGISSAVNSARILSEIFNAHLPDPNCAYWRKTRLLRFRLWLRIVKSWILDHAFLRKCIMKSGIQSLNLYRKDSHDGQT